ncbi:MAG: RNA methyltransferase [Fibrobacterales bacterium]
MKKVKVTFEEYYSGELGDRWPKLRAALLEEKSYFELKEGLRQSYFLDPASVRAASALSIDEGDMILDLCAAPGGKSLVIASTLPAMAHLKTNEKSPARRQRLKKVLDEHLTETVRSHTEVTGYDATKWGLFEKEVYDKVLLDAPCSSEAHVLQSPKHLKEWTPSRVKRLSQQQFAMVASALDALKEGGEMIYSTCALADAENDGVIEKLHKKRSGKFEILPVQEEIGEATVYGWKMWPDTHPGVGPIYYCKIRKTFSK